MSPDARSIELRRRAERLRRLADRIERCSVMQLDRYAGDDTWRGQRPALCVATLEHNQRQLFHAADDVRMHAMRLVREADLLGGVTG
jgi:hypothetical protein